MYVLKVPMTVSPIPYLYKSRLNKDKENEVPNNQERIPSSGQQPSTSLQPRVARETQNSNQLFRYPYTLGSSPEYQNFMTFEMFETGGQGLNSQKDSYSNNPFAGVGLQFPTAVLGGIAGEQLLSRFGGSVGQSILGKIGGAIGGGAILSLVTSGVGADVFKQVKDNFGYYKGMGTGEFGFNQETTGFNTANKRVDKTICLYLPSNIKTSYGAEYTEEDMTATAQAASTLKLTAQTLSNMTKGGAEDLKGSLSEGTGNLMGRQALKVASETLSVVASPIFGGDLKLDKLYEGMTRSVANPMVMNMFKSVKRRSFSFSYKFVPTSKEELYNVYNILTLFKKYSMPKRADDSSGGRLLEYPAEWRIRFWHGAQENLFLPKIARCCLKDINITYGDTPFTTFAPEAGFGAAPTKYELELTFEELEILVQQRIDQGY